MPVACRPDSVVARQSNCKRSRPFWGLRHHTRALDLVAFCYIIKRPQSIKFDPRPVLPAFSSRTLGSFRSERDLDLICLLSPTLPGGGTTAHSIAAALCPRTCFSLPESASAVLPIQSSRSRLSDTGGASKKNVCASAWLLCAPKSAGIGSAAEPKGGPCSASAPCISLGTARRLPKGTKRDKGKESKKKSAIVQESGDICRQRRGA